MRIDFFGDEVESIRKFDPETQRSSSQLDTALLLPLTEIPITEKVLEAINARLTRSGSALGGETPAELQTHVAGRTGEATVFPGWEFFAPVAGATKTLLELMGPATRVFVEEPAMIKNQGERWWNKVEQRHDRSGIGNLIRPEDIYLSPWALDDRMRGFCGAELDQLGAVDILDGDRSAYSEVEFHTRPTMRFHGSVPALMDAINTLIKQESRVLLTAPNQGEVERLAGLMQEYGVAYRLGSRNMAAGSETIYSESSYLAGSTAVPVIVRTPIANGVQVLDLAGGARQIFVFGANDLTDEADVTARPVTRRSKTSAFISDFRDLAVGDYVVHIEHGIAQYCGLRVLEEGSDANLELMILEFAEGAKLYVPLTRLDLISKYRSTETGPAPVLNKLGNQAWQKTKARVKKAMADMAAELLKLYAQRKAAEGTGLLAGQQPAARVRGRLPLQRNRRPARGRHRHQARHGIDPAHGPAAVRRRGLRQDRSCHARGVQGRAGLETGRRPDPHHRAQLPAFRELQEALRSLPRQGGNAVALPHREGENRDRRSRPKTARSTSSSAPTRSSRRSSSSRISACSSSMKSSASASSTRSA